MIRPSELLAALTEAGVTAYIGVPDSLMKAFLAHVQAAAPADRHLITANEGAAVGVAIGHHLRTGEVPLVYLQNSGLGNAVNPLLSLASPEVYGIPMLLLMGWRGEPGVKDEPQHVTQGRVQNAMLDAMGVPWTILPDDPADLPDVVATAARTAREQATPVALVVRRDTFATEPATSPGPVAGADPGSRADVGSTRDLPSREEALQIVVEASEARTVLVATTGMLGRELFELRANRSEGGTRDFLTVGGMGHATSIALGIARAAPDDEVWALDGDGALLMHLGVLPVVATCAPRRFLHVLFDNGVHDSVGGQPTPMGLADPVALARAAGYPVALRAEGAAAITTALNDLRGVDGPRFLHIPVLPGNREDLGRPTRTPAESRARFITALTGDAPA